MVQGEGPQGRPGSAGAGARVKRASISIVRSARLTTTELTSALSRPPHMSPSAAQSGKISRKPMQPALIRLPRFL